MYQYLLQMPWLFGAVITFLLAMGRKYDVGNVHRLPAYEIAWGWLEKQLSFFYSPLLKNVGLEIMKSRPDLYEQIAEEARMGQITALQSRIMQASDKDDQENVGQLNRQLAELTKQLKSHKNSGTLSFLSKILTLVVLFIAMWPLFVNGYMLKYTVLIEMVGTSIKLTVGGSRIDLVPAIVAVGMVAIEWAAGAVAAWGVDYWRQGNKGAGTALILFTVVGFVALIAAECFMGLERHHVQELRSGIEGGSPVWHIVISGLIPAFTFIDGMGIKVLLPEVMVSGASPIRKVGGMVIIGFGVVITFVLFMIAAWLYLVGMCLAMLALLVWELGWMVISAIFGWIWNLLRRAAAATVYYASAASSNNNLQPKKADADEDPIELSDGDDLSARDTEKDLRFGAHIQIPPEQR